MVGMYVDIAADGRVTAAVPEAGTLPALGDALAKRALHWHYVPAVWEGKPVAVRQWLNLQIEPVPTTGGGYAIRILGPGTRPDPLSHMPPPAFPRKAMIAGTNALLVYRVRVAEDGSMSVVELLEPDSVKGHVKSLDKVSRAAIADFRRPPILVDGVAIACEMRFPMGFFTTKKIPMPDLSKLEPLARECPGAKLETELAGTML